MSAMNHELVMALPTFKKGLVGISERRALTKWMRMALELRRAPERIRVLDVGSGDGSRLKKTMAAMQRAGFIPDVVALEPFDNPALRSLERAGVRIDTGHAEEMRYEAEFDLVLATQVDYYYARPAEVYKCVRDALRPGGHVAVTLVTDGCILNRITRFMLDGVSAVTPVTADSCELRRGVVHDLKVCRVIETHGRVDVPYFLSSDERLLALGIVLARNAIDGRAVAERLAQLRRFLRSEGTLGRRVNQTLIARRIGCGLEARD